MMLEAQKSNVNLGVLDQLVWEYIELEQLAEGQFPTSAIHLQEVCENVRGLIHSGKVAEACGVIKETKPELLEDARLLFRLVKQEMTEYLRIGDADGIKLAIQCAREKLAPLALNAYPEAYAEFQEAMLLFVYRPDHMSSPVEALWCEQSRTELAGIVSRTLRQALGVVSPKLGYVMRYLALMYRAVGGEACRPSGDEPHAFLDNLLLNGRDPCPLPSLACSVNPTDLAVADIQALRAALSISQQEALEALRLSGGDLRAAFLAELDALRVNVPLLDRLVREYAKHRDLLHVSDTEESEGGLPAAPGGNTEEMLEMDTEELLDMDTDDDQMSASKPAGEAGPGDLDAAGPSGVLAPCLDPSPKRKALSEFLGGEDVVGSRADRQPFRSPPKKVPRWRGRAGMVPGVPNPDGCGTQGNGSEPAGRPTPLRSPGASTTGEYRQLVRLRNMLETGAFLQVEEELRKTIPDMEEKRPAILFELLRCRFDTLLVEGKHPEAVLLARERMAPLSTAHPWLLPSLQASMARLTCTPSMTSPAESIRRVSAMLQEDLQEALGLNDPLLLTFFKETLAARAAWFRRQQCRDVLGAFLDIDSLVVGDSLLLSSPSARRTGSGTQGGGPHQDTGPGSSGSLGNGSASGSLLALAANSTLEHLRSVNISAFRAAIRAGSYRDSVARIVAEIQERGRASSWPELAAAAPREGPEDASEEEGDDDANEGAGDGPRGLSESAILSTMEITEMDRASAIELLSLHGGDVNAVMNIIYG